MTNFADWFSSPTYSVYRRDLMDSNHGAGNASAHQMVRPPAVGIGLNKTGTKTLRWCLRSWGYRHRSYDLEAFRLYHAGRTDELLGSMEDFDSFEDWPWPLLYREVDAHFPDARFLLTIRRDSETWYRSLCKMAVRIGPLRDVEQPVYGYAMPQGHRSEVVDYYERHNADVRAYFANRPGKLLELCWEREGTADALADFLGEERLPDLPHINESARVYGGDRRWIAEMNRLVYQPIEAARRRVRRFRRRNRRRR